MNGQIQLQQDSITTLVIDSNFIQKLGDINPERAQAYWNLLYKLSDRLFLWSVSEITMFENTQGLWGEKYVAARDYMLKFRRFIVDKNVLLVAARLGGLYGHPSNNEMYRRIDHGDKIIAATALLERGAVLTENVKDFPAPYFHHFEHQPITYLEKKLQKTDNVYICYSNNLLVEGLMKTLDDKNTTTKQQA